MNKSRVSFRDYRSTIGAKLIEEIVRDGYTPAALIGRAYPADFLMEQYRGEISILHKDPRDVGTTSLFGLIKHKPRRRMLATIWTDNPLRNATSKHWVVETWGTENIADVTKLIDGYGEKFGATAEIRLLSGQNRYESFDSDDVM